MTQQIDKFWIARGVAAEELTALKGRTAIYIGLGMMGTAAALLACGIVLNVIG